MRWLLILSIFYTFGLSVTFSQAQTTQIVPQLSSPELLPSTVQLTVLDKIFPNIPVQWEDEPRVPAGDWLSGLGIRWELKEDCLILDGLPFRPSVTWAIGAEEVRIGEQSVKVAPLQRDGDNLWLPLLSLGRSLGLKVWANREKQKVNLLSPLLKAQLTVLPVGWLLEITLGYPIPMHPKTGFLSNPPRTYADFAGAVLDISPGIVMQSDGFVYAIRVGQFSDDPYIARVVADVKAPAILSLVGRERLGDGSEVWKLLVQPSNERRMWLGQISLAENTSSQARLLLRGWFGELGRLRHEANQIVVDLPAAPLTPPELMQGDEDSIVQSVTAEVGKTGTKMIVQLNHPAKGRWRLKGNDIVELLIEPPRPDKSRAKLIVVDAGHGGQDPGARSPRRLFKPRLVEKTLTLDIAVRLKRLLEQKGFQVIMTRESDVYVPLPERVVLANSIGADVFVSVHLNAYSKPGGQWGTEVYYSTSESRPLAECIYRQLLTLLGRKGNGVRQRQLYVIRKTTMPSALVEACYMDHPEEEELLRDERFRERIAIAICRGIMDFFGDRRTLERKEE